MQTYLSSLSTPFTLLDNDPVYHFDLERIHRSWELVHGLLDQRNEHLHLFASSYVKMACPVTIRSKFTMIRSLIQTHGTCDSGWSEWEKRGSRSWLKSVTGSNLVIQGNDSMLTMRCNKKMPMNGNSKKLMERQPYWRTFQATFIFVLFLT